MQVTIHGPARTATYAVASTTGVLRRRSAGGLGVVVTGGCAITIVVGPIIFWNGVQVGLPISHTRGGQSFMEGEK